MRLLGARTDDRSVDVGHHRRDGSAVSGTGHDRERIVSVAAGRRQFLETLIKGTTLFDSAVADLRASGRTTLPGDQALHFTIPTASDRPPRWRWLPRLGLSVDREGFTRLMTEQRERAKADARARKSV